MTANGYRTFARNIQVPDIYLSSIPFFNLGSRMAPGFRIGSRLSFGGDLCTVRYVGLVQGTKGQWLGIEWDDPTRGKHNGQAGGVRYFDCV